MKFESVCHNCAERRQGCHKSCEKAAQEKILRAMMKSSEAEAKATDYGVRCYKNLARRKRKSNPSRFTRNAEEQMKYLS